MPELTRLPWRIGRKVGRTVYAVIGDEATDDDFLIGMFDTRELAAEAVEAHNARLPWQERRVGV